jgi:hypothetical protein
MCFLLHKSLDCFKVRGFGLYFYSILLYTTGWKASSYRNCLLSSHVCYSFQDVCGELLMRGDTEGVKRLLSHHTVSKLWPLVLLHVWKNFADRDEIFVVVSFVIEQCKVCVWGCKHMLYDI